MQEDDEDSAERYEDYKRFIREAQKNRDNNQEKFDEAILKYAALLLGGLILFAQKTAENRQLVWFWWGIPGAVSLALSVGLSIVAYKVANAAIEQRAERSYSFFLKNDLEMGEPTRLDVWKDRIELWSICTLALGTLLGTIFIGANLYPRGTHMSEEKKMIGPCIANDAKSVPLMVRPNPSSQNGSERAKGSPMVVLPKPASQTTQPADSSHSKQESSQK